VITKKEIKELTDFLPLIYDNKIELSKPYRNADMSDMISGGFYKYHPSVLTFFELASQDHWKDYQYVDNFSEKMIEPGKIEEASINQLKTIITWCDRMERFFEGHWEYVIENDIIKRVLKRLIQLNKG
jgi:NDP-sugar pyrophosphorylase family protein